MKHFIHLTSITLCLGAMAQTLPPVGPHGEPILGMPAPRNARVATEFRCANRASLTDGGSYKISVVKTDGTRELNIFAGGSIKTLVLKLRRAGTGLTTYSDDDGKFNFTIGERTGNASLKRDGSASGLNCQRIKSAKSETQTPLPPFGPHGEPILGMPALRDNQGVQ
jgi:hypothetical protein